MSKYVDYGLGAVKKAFMNANPPPPTPLGRRTAQIFGPPSQEWSLTY